jgi:hypothetical protein
MWCASGTEAVCRRRAEEVTATFIKKGQTGTARSLNLLAGKGEQGVRMSDHYTEDVRERSVRDLYRDPNSTAPVWVLILIAAAVVVGSLFYFYRDTTNSYTPGTTANLQPSSPGTGSGGPQGSSNNPSTIGSSSRR